MYKDTTSRLQGYSNDFLVLSSLSCIHLIRLKLFSRCAGTFFSMGSRVLASNHEMRCVGPLMFDTIGLNLMSGPFLYILIRW